MHSNSDSLRSFVLLLMLALLAGCDGFPRDPEKSLERIREHGVLRVGAIFNSPWVVPGENDQLSGAEGDLLHGFATHLGVELDVAWGGNEELFEALIHNELDIIAGGFSAENPWLEQSGFTNPYYVSRALVAMPPGSEPVAHIDGRSVSVKPHSGLRHLIERKGGKAHIREDLFASEDLVATDSWEIAGQEWLPTEIELSSRDQVIAVAPGENALLLELERYLFRHNDVAALEAALWKAAKQ